MVLLNQPTIEEYEAAVKKLDSKDLLTSIEAAFTVLSVKSVENMKIDAIGFRDLEREETHEPDHETVATKASLIVGRFDELDDNQKIDEFRRQAEKTCDDMLHSKVKLRKDLGINVLLGVSSLLHDPDLTTQASRIWKDLSQDIQNDFLNKLPGEMKADLTLEVASNLLHSAPNDSQRQEIVDWLRPLLFSSEELEAELQGILIEGTAAELTQQVLKQNGINPLAILPGAGFGLGIAATTIPMEATQSAGNPSSAGM